jgi:hypothetical protein
VGIDLEIVAATELHCHFNFRRVWKNDDAEINAEIFAPKG